MCGRFNVTSDPLTQLLMELVGMAHPGPNNFNAAPTETITVLRLNEAGDPELVALRWWLTPYWAKEMSSKYSMFNAKSETVTKSPAFREPFKKRRCVVSVSGFYEWVRHTHGEPGAPAKLPYYITPNEADGLLLAGLWDRWLNKNTGEVVESFTILTTSAHPSLEFVHSRQPVMLSMSDALRWLDPAPTVQSLETLFAPALPMQLEARPVSSHVNNARNKDERCVDVIGEPVILPADPLL